MGYFELKTEIALPAYDGMTDDQIAAALNAKSVAAPDRVVPVLEVTTWLRTNGLWLPLKNAVGTSAGAAAAVDYNEDPRTLTLDFNLAIVQAMLADLVAKSLLTQPQADALTALKTMPAVSRAAQLGWAGDVTPADIINARAT